MRGRGGVNLREFMLRRYRALLRRYRALLRRYRARLWTHRGVGSKVFVCEKERAQTRGIFFGVGGAFSPAARTKVEATYDDKSECE